MGAWTLEAGAPAAPAEARVERVAQGIAEEVEAHTVKVIARPEKSAIISQHWLITSFTTSQDTTGRRGR
jgi:hypothetical protein